ncbi:MAG: phospholipid/cholesterol/gamma-HCH transport system substrate-binding protein, partial [Solirubrobacteraceae bacterium]|nr:phospholipid/cholesterol/gamma-HCH transport system substrate-binding protein [Solirubrobacteraceae bacterium]
MRRVAVAGLIAVAVACAALVASGRGPSHTLVVSLADARGLVDGADVRVAGVRVGKVTRLGLGRDGYPRARLSVSAVPRRSARVTLRLASLSGERNRYLALDPGSGAALPEGAVLGRDRTRSPVEIDDVLSALTPSTRADVRAVVGGLR